MANRLKGITLEIGGDTTSLSKALSGVNSEIKNTQQQLKDVEKLLKLDPTNIDLLRQREKLLNDEVKQTTTKVEELKKAQAQLDASGVDKTSEQYMALQREIISTEQELKKLEDAAQHANATLSQVGAVADKVASGAGKVASATKGMSMAAGGALTAIGGMAYKAITAADDLNTLSKQSGFTTAELQKMEYAADRIDVSMEDITSSAQKLKKNMGSGSGAVGDAFAQLGISVTKTNGEMRDSTQVYWEVISALSRVRNETERDQLAMTLLGKGADSLAGIIDDGGAAFRALGKEAEDAGLIMSQETLDGLNSVNDKIDELKAKASATASTSGAKALEAFMPVLESIINGIDKLLQAIGKMSSGQIKFILQILAVVAAISPVAGMISKIATLISFMSTSVIPALGKALAFLNANPIFIVIAAIIALIAVAWKFRDQIKEVFEKVMEVMQNLWRKMGDVFQRIIDFVKNNFTNGWKNAWQNVVNTFKNIFGMIATAAKTPINKVISLINGVIDKINWFIEKANGVTSKVGIKLGTIGNIPMLAKGGVLSRGSAIVGEAGEELLTMQNGKAIVQPLTATVDSAGLKSALSGIGGNTQVTINFEGSLAQLGKVLQPVITTEALRRGRSLINN